ncbi:MAG: DNA polymerase III subunit beta [Pseudomonadota bacterium]
MEATIERATLVKALGHVQSVVERRNTIPILGNVLIQAEAGALSFTATDLDIEILETAAADVAQQGATTTDAVRLHDIVRKLPDGAQVRLSLDADQGRLRITAGRSEFFLAVLPQADFPTLAADDLPVQFSMETSALRRLMEKARFAMSQEETRYYLNGVYLHAAPEGEAGPLLRAASTDGHRLARLETALPSGAEKMPGVIVPRKAVNELTRLLQDSDETVTISLSETKIRFNFGPGRLTSKLIDGTFPDYERVIPKDWASTMLTENSDFASAVDRVSTVSADRTRSIKLALESDRLKLTVNNPEAGSALEEMSVDYQGDALEIGFNARYLLDVCQQIDGERAAFSLSDPSSPTVITDPEDKGALYVLMPLRV